MAGRIIANTIVPGYPEPGVTADEIVGMINRYGLPLIGFTGPISKKYNVNLVGTAKYLVNSSIGVGPAACKEEVTLEAWPVPSSILVSVSAAFYFTLSSPQTGYDSNTLAGIEILMDGVSAISAYGSIGQSSLNAANPVAAHSFYEAFYVDTVPAGIERLVTGRFKANGNFVVVQADAGLTINAIVRVKVLRVMA